MAYTTQCNNKGCGQFMEPYLDPQDNKVYCSSCDKEISNITSFTKHQMKMNKQFKKKSKIAFSFACKKCGKEDVPIMLNEDIVCANCKSPLDNLSTVFKNMLKQKLKSIKGDI